MNYNYRAFFNNGRAPSQSSIYNNPYANNTNNNEGSNSSTYIRMIPIVNNTGSLNNSNMNDSNGKFSAKNASSASLLNQHRLSMFNYDYQTNNKQPTTCSTTETLRRKNSFNSTIGTGVSDKRANTINNSPHFTSNTDLSYGAGSYISLSPKSSMLNSKRFNSIINNMNTINNNNNSANIANQNRKSLNGGSNRTINSMHITNVRNHVNYINNMNSINHQQHQQSPSFFAGNNNNSSNNSHNGSNMNIKKKPKSKYDNDNSNDSTESSCSVDESSSIISDMEFDNKSEKKCNFSPPKSRQFQSTPNEMIITNRYSTISNNNNNNGKTMNTSLNRKSLANSKEMSDSLLALKDKTNNLKLNNGNNSNNNKENFENHKYTFKPLINESHQQPTLSFQQHRNQHGVNSYSKSISVSNKPITRRGLASVSTAQNPYQIRIVSNKDLLNSKKYSIISTPTINLANEDMNSLKYSKSTYYKRIDDYSSNDSLNKNNSWIKSLKKSSSLYYDSGIGADVSFIHSSNLSNLSKEPKANYSSNNTINGIYNRKLDKPSSTQAYCTNTNNNLYKPEGSTMSNKYAHNDVQLRPTSHKRYHYSETLNPNLVRKLCSTSNNSNRLALHSSSSSSSSSDKARKTFEAIFRLNNQNNANNANNTAANANIPSNNVSSANNNEKTSNTIEISNNNEMNNENKNSNSCMNSTNKQSIKHNSSNDLGRNSIVGQNQIPTISINNDNSSNSFFKNDNFALARKSSITSLNEMNSNQINGSYNNSYTRADFTPNLTRNAISKTSLIKRKLSMPPPPIINNTFNNMGYVSNNNINVNNNATIGSSATSISAIKISSNSNINNTYPMFKTNLYSNNTKQSTQNLNVINNNNGKTSNNGSTLDLLSNISASKNVQNKFDSISNINYDRENSASNMFPNLNDIYYTSQPVYARNSKIDSIKSNAIALNKQAYNENNKNTSQEKLCIAIEDYIALYSKNISLKKGEKYTILNKENQNWFYVRDRMGNSGFAPSNYLQYVTYDKLNTEDKTHYEKDWFHSNMTRSQAYMFLVSNNNENGTFLIRNNSSEKGKYTLCVFKNGKVYNYKINSQENKLFITSKHKFNNLVELVNFYRKTPAGLVCNLRYPAVKNSREKKFCFDNVDPIYKKYTVERKDIEFFEKIGSGQFGVVLKAEYKQRKVVAVKKMKPGSKEDEINFSREAEFMMKLQDLQEFQHKNLVQFFGISKDVDDSILIVTEFVKYGSLYNYLQKHKERIVNSKSRFLRLINICLDVCDGMEYLESKHIIHRDLATRNCLVGEGEVIKVADFGLARFTEDFYIAHPQSQFPVKWSAPEVIKYRSYSNKSDVWSFSCLMYEVFTLGKMPYGGNTTNSIAAKQIISGMLPERPVYCPVSLYDNVMIKAWSKEPKDRPSFSDLLKLLGTLIN